MSEFYYQRIMVGCINFDSGRFNGFQTSVVNMIDILPKNSGPLVFSKSHRPQI
jgi:hypothetical protein